MQLSRFLTIARRARASLAARAGQLVGLALVGWIAVTTGGGFPS
jgi:hypothetical protein